MLYHRLFVVFTLMVFAKPVILHVEFTNLKCQCVDTSFCVIQSCYIKPVNRSYKHATIDVAVLQLPIDNITLRARLWKRGNGYKPFLYDITVDGCRFLRKPYNQVLKFFYDFLKPYTNMNHTCPYNHNVSVSNMPTNNVNSLMSSVVPYPKGDYMFETIWSPNNIIRATVKLYFSVQ